MEFKRLLAEAGVEAVGAKEAGVEIVVEEDGATFLANAQKKARAYAEASALPVLADDSGLVVEALGGAPGVLSARFGGPGLDDAGRVRYLLQQMEGVAERSARYVCVLALARPGRPARDVFVGQCDGRIAREPRGEGGFGYDPVFLVPDGRTMAEVPPEEKDVLSHRGRAIREMREDFDLAGWAGR